MWTKQVTESHIIAVLQLIKLCKQKAKENQYPFFFLIENWYHLCARVAANIPSEEKLVLNFPLKVLE